MYKIRNRMERLIRIVKNSCVFENSRPVHSHIYPRQGTKIKPRFFPTERQKDLSEGCSYFQTDIPLYGFPRMLSRVFLAENESLSTPDRRDISLHEKFFAKNMQINFLSD
jgi:hypothetical protein